MKAHILWNTKLSGLLALAVVVNACGGNSSTQNGGGNPPPPPPPATTEVLFATSLVYEAVSYGVNLQTGVLASPTFVHGTNGTYGIAATPSKKYLYTNDRAASGVDGYAIGESGTLTPINGSPFALPFTNSTIDMDAIAMHPSGKFLYTVEAGANVVAGFQIDAGSGALTAIPGSPFPAGSTPQVAVADPSGNFLYVSNSLGVLAFAIDATTGALTQTSASPFLLGSGAEGLAVHPTGKFLFVCLPGAGSIAAFNIDAATGALNAVEGSPFPSIELMSSLTMDPKGKFLYTLGDFDGRIFGYSIDSTTGKLTSLAGSPFGLPEDLGNSTITIDPSGQFLYAAGGAFDGVLSYQIDTGTGSLTAITPAGDPTGDQQYQTYPLGLTVLQFS